MITAAIGVVTCAEVVHDLTAAGAAPVGVICGHQPLVTVGLAATGLSYILIGDTQGRARRRRNGSAQVLPHLRRSPTSPLALPQRSLQMGELPICSGLRMRHRPPQSQSHGSGFSLVGVVSVRRTLPRLPERWL